MPNFELDPVMEARLLKKYRDFAKNVGIKLMVSERGYRNRKMVESAFYDQMDLTAHEGVTVPGLGPPKGFAGWRCNLDCLTCYEQRRDVATRIQPAGL